MYLLYCTVLYCTVLYCTVVMTPPKQPNLSMRMTSAPALLAASAADSPEGPPPTTSTSHLSVDKGFRSAHTLRKGVVYVIVLYSNGI